MNLHKFIFSIIAFCALVFVPRISFASSCKLPEFDEYFKRSAIVASASVIEHMDENKILLQFEKAWKGAPPKEKIAEIGVGYGNMGGPTKYVQPEIGTRYVLYIYRIYEDIPSRIHLHHCSRSGLYEGHKDLESLNLYQEKIHLLDKKISETANSREALLEKVKFLKEYEDFDNAIPILNGLIQLNPKDTLALSELSDLYYQLAEKTHVLGRTDEIEVRKKNKQKLYEQALLLAEKALSIEPNNKKAINVKVTASLSLDKNIDEDFIDLDISNTELKFKNFSELKFISTSFEGTFLYGVDFSSASLENVNLNNAHIKNVRFQNTSFSNCIIEGADIHGFIREEEKEKFGFSTVEIENSTIENSSFDNTRFMLPIINTKIKKSSFENASGQKDSSFEVFMDGVHVENSSFKNVYFSQTGFDLGIIRNSVFKNSNFEGATIQAQLISNDFSTSNLKNVSLLGGTFDCNTKWPKGFDPIEHGGSPIVKKCGSKEFPSHNFEGRKFKEHQKFGPINLESANFKYTELVFAMFYGANLKNADFTGAKFGNTDFRNANLEGAIFRNLKLERVNFADANLAGTDFTGSVIGNWEKSYFKGAKYNKQTVWPTYLDKKIDPEALGAVLVEIED